MRWMKPSATVNKVSISSVTEMTRASCPDDMKSSKMTLFVESMVHMQTNN